MRPDDEFSIEWAIGASRQSLSKWRIAIEKDRRDVEPGPAGRPEGTAADPQASVASPAEGACKIRGEPIVWICARTGLSYADFLDAADADLLNQKYGDPSEYLAGHADTLDR